MLVKAGNKIHVITRRLFEGDIRRHFIGEVIDSEGGIVRAKGYTFVFDTRLNKYVRRPEKRDRIFSFIDSGNIVNILPDSSDIETSVVPNTSAIETRLKKHLSDKGGPSQAIKVTPQ